MGADDLLELEFSQELSNMIVQIANWTIENQIIRRGPIFRFFHEEEIEPINECNDIDVIYTGGRSFVHVEGCTDGVIELFIDRDNSHKWVFWRENDQTMIRLFHEGELLK